MIIESCGCIAPGGLEDDLDGVLERFRSAVEKAEDPTRPAHFLRLEARLVKKLRRAFGEAKAPFEEQLKELLARVDVTQVESVDHFVAKLVAIGRGLDRAAAQEVAPILEAAVSDIYKMTKGAVFERLLDIGRVAESAKPSAAFGFKDERAVDLLNRHQNIYVQQGVRQALGRFDEEAKGILTAGLEQGQTRTQVAGALYDAFGDTIGSEDYWNVVGSAWINRSRNWSTIQTLDDVEIDTFIIIAMLDERTSTICRFMNGLTFDVKRQLEIMDQVAHDDDLDALKKRSPWLRSRQSAKDEDEVGYTRGGRFTVIGRAGTLVTSESKIQEAGVALPPYHGLCRTTVGVL